MNRLIGSFLAVAFALSVAPAAIASSTSKCPTGETYTKGYTKADGTKVSGYCSTKGGAKAAPAAAATAASKTAPAAMSTAKAAPANAMATAKAAPGAMATAAAGSANKSATSASKTATGATSCPPGKTYVNGYTKQDGTKVAGYCRSAPSK